MIYEHGPRRKRRRSIGTIATTPESTVAEETLRYCKKEIRDACSPNAVRQLRHRSFFGELEAFGDELEVRMGDLEAFSLGSPNKD